MITNQYFMHHLTASAKSGQKGKAEPVVAPRIDVCGRKWRVLGPDTTDQVTASLRDSDVTAGKHTGELKTSDPQFGRTVSSFLGCRVDPPN